MGLQIPPSEVDTGLHLSVDRASEYGLFLNSCFGAYFPLRIAQRIGDAFQEQLASQDLTVDDLLPAREVFWPARCGGAADSQNGTENHSSKLRLTGREGRIRTLSPPF
jgi:hypothetical protein